MNNINWHILNEKQTEIIKKLDCLPKDIYLAGGTAVALYFGHRTSLDFDLYTGKHFFQNAMHDHLLKNFTEKEILPRANRKDIYISSVNTISVSVFYYPYKLIKPLILTKHILMADLLDIAAMKSVAIIQRPAKRDYIDMYYILQTLSLEKIFLAAKKKYINFNTQLALHSLGFFEDIEHENIEKRGIMMLDKNFSWDKLKDYLWKKVKHYQINVLSK